MVERLLFPNIEKALAGGLTLTGGCFHYDDCDGLRVVRVSKPFGKDKRLLIGMGYTIEEAISEVDHALYNVSYQYPEIANVSEKGADRFSSDLDFWLLREGSFSCKKQEGVIEVGIFGPGPEFYYRADGDCFEKALDKAFPGEKKKLEDCLSKPSAKRAVMPFCVPLLHVNPNRFVQERPLNHPDSCVRFDLRLK